MLHAGAGADLGAALALGLATGPVCLASCGPAVLPWMLGLPAGLAGHARQLALFLVARLAGYLLFGTASWLAGAAVARLWTGQSWMLGVVQIALAVALVFYAFVRSSGGCEKKQCGAALVQIGGQSRERGALMLGLLTGLNLCPPFLAAGTRAAESASLGGALLFFAAFFVGTALWFLPLAPLGLLRRTAELHWVARAAAALVALWYGLTGVALIVGGIRG